MARKKRTDSRGRVLRVGESQNKQGRYCYRWTEPVTGKRGTVYALSLVELREKEQQIQKDIQDGINTNSASLLKQKELDLVLGKRVKERPIDGIKGFVFITSNGTPILPFNFNDVLRNITNAYNKKESKLAAAEHREPILLPHITAHGRVIIRTS